MKRRSQLHAVVCLVFVLTLPLHVGLCTGAESTTAPGESSVVPATLIVLRDGGVLTGNVSRIDGGYLIHRGGTEIQIPASKVLIVCQTLTEAYEARRADVVRGG